MKLSINKPTPTLDPGAYEMALVDVEGPKTFDAFIKEKDSFGNPDDGVRIVWTWAIPDDPSIDIQYLTKTATGPRSNVFAILVALLGAEKATAMLDRGDELDTDTLLGKHAVVTVGLNTGGYSKVDAIGPVPKALPKKPVPMQVEAEEDPSLPF
jgi:hypothetical protein